MRFLLAAFIFAFTLGAMPHASYAQIDLGLDISVGTPPPAFPVYVQPAPPEPDYIWMPGYWAYDQYDGYYWIPGTWAAAPQPGLLWTPPYWAWDNGNYGFHDGYWGPHVGFYGGINYGFGYTGVGFHGGEWHGDHFENHPMPGPNRSAISFNGGPGGVHAAPRPQDLIAAHDHHFAPTEEQRAHVEAAHQNPAFFANENHGRPPVAATARAGDLPHSNAPAPQAHEPAVNREDYNTHVLTSRPHPENPPVEERPAPAVQHEAVQPEHVAPPQPQHVQARPQPQHVQAQARPQPAPHPQARPAEHAAPPRGDDHGGDHGDDNHGR